MAAAKLSNKQTQEAFGIAHMTLHNWRKGTATKDPLPFETEGDGEKPKVSFRISALKAWAKKNGVEFAKDPQAILDKANKAATKKTARKGAH